MYELKHQPCVGCGNLVPEVQAYPYPECKEDCPLASEWRRDAPAPVKALADSVALCAELERDCAHAHKLAGEERLAKERYRDEVITLERERDALKAQLDAERGEARGLRAALHHDTDDELHAWAVRLYTEAVWARNALRLNRLPCDVLVKVLAAAPASVLLAAEKEDPDA